MIPRLQPNVNCAMCLLSLRLTPTTKPSILPKEVCEGNYLRAVALKRDGNYNRSAEGRRLWEMLVSYVNAPDPETAKSFAPLVNQAMEWIGGEGVDSHGNLNDLGTCRDLHSGATLDSLALVYREDIRGLLTWLAGSGDTQLAYRSCAILMQHGNAIEMRWQPGTEDTLISEWPESCGSVLSPVCRFIKDCISRHDSGSVPLRSAVPLALCDRPGCGRFRVIKVIRDSEHVFCSNLCKATFHQDLKGKSAQAEYMREYRATLDRNKRKAPKAPRVSKAGTGNSKARKTAKGGK